MLTLTAFTTLNSTRTPEDPIAMYRRSGTLHSIMEYLNRDVSTILFTSADVAVRMVFPQAKYCVHDEPVFELRKPGDEQWTRLYFEDVVYYYDLGTLKLRDLERFMQIVVSEGITD